MAYINGNEILFNAQMNGLVSIDQNYDPGSENPQSGRAVSQALATIPGATIDTAMSDDSENPVQNKVIKKYVDDATGQQEWELIYEEETTEIVMKISQKVYDLGDTSKGVRVALYIPPNTTLKNDRVSLAASLSGTNSLTVYASNWTTSSTQTLCVFDIRPKGLVWDIEAAPYTKVFNKVEGNGAGTDINPVVRYVAVQTGDGFPEGTIMKVWRLK